MKKLMIGMAAFVAFLFIMPEPLSYRLAVQSVVYPCDQLKMGFYIDSYNASAAEFNRDYGKVFAGIRHTGGCSFEKLESYPLSY